VQLITVVSVSMSDWSGHRTTQANMSTTRFSTIRKIGLPLCLVVSITILATSSSFAYSARAQQMCTGDAFRLCSSEIPNIARIVACMRRNRANLSQGCRAVMDQEDTATARTKPVRTAPVMQKPTVASPAEQPAVTETKPGQTAPAAQRPAITSPAEQPAVTETKPVQTAPVAQKPATATPLEMKPVEANSVSREKPVKLAQRKRNHRQPSHIHREFGNIERTIGFVLPLPFVIQFYW
jgi:hypothetical protein